jgi:superfamily I DNA and/or RNA helicase
MTDEEHRRLLGALRVQATDNLFSQAADEIERLARELNLANEYIVREVRRHEDAEPHAALAQSDAEPVAELRNENIRLKAEISTLLAQLCVEKNRGDSFQIVAQTIAEQLAVAEKQDHGAADRREADSERQRYDKPFG